MSDQPEIRAIRSSDVHEIVQHCVDVFHGLGMTDADTAKFSFLTTDWGISKKLVLNGSIIGFYLLHEGSIANWAASRLAWADEHDDCRAVYANCRMKEDLSRYETRKGVEGIGLVVLPQYRGRGYGDMLKDIPRHMGYDHIFGEHLKGSKNLQHWLKCRRLVAECDGIWVTVQDLPGKREAP